MEMYPDFRDLLCAFNDASVEYLVVGAHALAAHGLVRATKDLDVWVRPTRDNGAAVIAALEDFGAPLHGLTPEDIASGHVAFQIGVEPIRIDVLTSIDGVEFEDAWADRVTSRFQDQEAFVLSRDRLIQNKRAAARDQDLVDVRWLEEHLAINDEGEKG